MEARETVLFVCTGNTCRSPMAAALYNCMATLAGREAAAQSAGLAAEEGAPAARNAVLALAEYGIDLSAHRARNLTPARLEGVTRVMVMTPSHKAALEGSFSPPLPVTVLGVSDPFGGSLERYRACREELIAALCRAFGFAPLRASEGQVSEAQVPEARESGPEPQESREARGAPAGGPDEPDAPDGLAIVPLSEGLLGDAAALERLCFSHPWTEQALRDELRNPAAVYLAALVSGAFAGYAGMRHAAGEGYIDNIAVVPAFRRKGVATALLGRLEAFALGHGFSFLTLEVRPSNTEAVTLYRKLGFLPAGIRRRFYDDPTEDALLMTKTLPTEKEEEPR